MSVASILIRQMSRGILGASIIKNKCWENEVLKLNQRATTVFFPHGAFWTVLIAAQTKMYPEQTAQWPMFVSKAGFIRRSCATRCHDIQKIRRDFLATLQKSFVTIMPVLVVKTDSFWWRDDGRDSHVEFARFWSVLRLLLLIQLCQVKVYRYLWHTHTHTHNN